MKVCEEFVRRFNVLKRHAERGRVCGVHNVSGVRMAGDPEKIDLDAEYQSLASIGGATQAEIGGAFLEIRQQATGGLPSVGFSNDFWSVDRPTTHEAVIALEELLNAIGQQLLIRQQSRLATSSELFDELDPPPFDAVQVLSQLELERAKTAGSSGEFPEKWTPQTVPGDCRDESGAPCTTDWVLDRYGIDRAKLSREGVSKRGKVGRQNVYSHDEIKAISDQANN